MSIDLRSASRCSWRTRLDAVDLEDVVSTNSPGPACAAAGVHSLGGRGGGGREWWSPWSSLPVPDRDELEPLPPSRPAGPRRHRAAGPRRGRLAADGGDPKKDLSFDRFEGLTPDGLVLRARYVFPTTTTGRPPRPATGRTDWLRHPGDVGEPQVAALTMDQLVLLDNRKGLARALLVLDRATLTWTSSVIRLPSGIEAHVPPQLRLGPDDRLYVGSNMENEYPIHWWSFPVPEGGDLRREPGLADRAVAWNQDVHVTADIRGRVVRTVAGGSRTLSDDRPAGCPVPRTRLYSELELAGDRPVVTYFCGKGDELQEASPSCLPSPGRPGVEVPGGVLAADRDLVLLSGSGDGSSASTSLTSTSSPLIASPVPSRTSIRTTLRRSVWPRDWCCGTTQDQPRTARPTT